MQTLFFYFNEYVMHFAKHIPAIMQSYDLLVYFILFMIIFCETGLVITPFLPGDSLLFACGALSATADSLDFLTLYIICLVAAILGDTSNYFIGEEFGNFLIKRFPTIIKPAYIEKAVHFYEKHGHKAIFLCRFVPIVRTFAPFVAGIGSMHYRTFIIYNVLGAITWVTLFTVAGYFFGNIPVVKANFSLVTLGIILFSVVPILWEFAKHHLQRDKFNK